MGQQPIMRLALASSIMLAIDRANQARLYKLDANFKDLHDVEPLQRP